ncbi:neuropeptide Y receptor type 2-like isoform X2 [Ochlerotatus camptorhynchus]|uniref:neuropeptide Y receptor type 2-like isoform X2 n=1 Tax=Ochlerotatus camptorhynchus TaxID=644619 RepID=UPI0031E3D7C2
MKTGFSLQPDDTSLKMVPVRRFFWAMPVAINTSEYNYPFEVWDQIPDKDIIIKLTILIPIVLFGILGNVSLLEIIFSNRALRTPTHLLIANLALIDLVTLVLCPTFFILHDIHQSYVLGPIGCKLEGFVEGGLLITSVLALCVVSYDRLAAIVLSRKARFKLMSVIIASILCWILGFAAALPLAIYRNYKERDWSNFHETYCSEDKQVMPLYWDYVIVLLVWLPLGVMMVTYSTILCKLDQYERKAMNREHPMVVRYKSRVAKTLFIVLITFVVVRIPFTVMILIFYKNVDSTNRFAISENFVLIWWFSKVAFIFLYSALNPVIYGLTNRTFRRAFRSSIILGVILRLSEDKDDDDDQVAKKLQMPRIMTFSRKPGEKGIPPYRTKNRSVANWLNSTIRRKDRNLSVNQPETKSPEANGTKSSETAQNGSHE